MDVPGSASASSSSSSSSVSTICKQPTFSTLSQQLSHTCSSSSSSSMSRVLMSCTESERECVDWHSTEWECPHRSILSSRAGDCFGSRLCDLPQRTLTPTLALAQSALTCEVSLSTEGSGASCKRQLSGLRASVSVCTCSASAKACVIARAPKTQQTPPSASTDPPAATGLRVEGC